MAFAHRAKHAKGCTASSASNVRNMHRVCVHEKGDDELANEQEILVAHA